MSFSKETYCAKLLQFCPTLCDPVNCSHQAPLSTDSPGENAGVGWHAVLQGGLPDPGIEPMCLTFPVLAGRFFTTSSTWEALKEMWELEKQWRRCAFKSFSSFKFSMPVRKSDGTVLKMIYNLVFSFFLFWKNIVTSPVVHIHTVQLI